MSSSLPLRSHLFGGLYAVVLAALAASSGRAQVEWTRVGDAPVLSPSDNDWDSFGVHSPFVIERGGELWMYYGGHSAVGNAYNSRIGLARSPDGVEWTRVDGNPVLSPGAAAWERNAVQEPSVVYDASSERLFMWYAGVNLAGGLTGATCAIGLATSADGMIWEKHEGGANAVAAAEDTWDRPCIDGYVLHDGAGYKLWYIGGGSDNNAFLTFKVGHATSDDGIHWRKYAGNPVLVHDSPGNPAGVFSPCLLWDAASETYEMWYSISTGSNGNSSIGYATSSDGVTWCKHHGNPVFVAVQHPMVLFDGGEYRMWYAGGAAPGIGLATSPWSIPRASFTASTPAPGSLAIAVDASRSRAPNATITGYLWDFGDGNTLTTGEPQAAHTYARPGRYRIQLTVADEQDREGCVARAVDVTLSPGDVAPWVAAVIGDPLFPGSASPEVEPACLRVSAGGKLLSGSSDQCQFVYREVTGDAVLTARIAEATGAGDRWEVGVMLRESLDPGARHLSMVLHKEPARARFRSVGRTSTGRAASGSSFEDAAAPDAWVRVERTGDELIGLTSKDGQAWTEVKRITLEGLPATILAGTVAAGRDARTDGHGGYDALVAKVCEIDLSPPGTGPFRRGDCNGDGAATGSVTDAVFLLGFMFLGSAGPDCRAACDANADGQLDLSDAVYVLAHNFLGGAAPPAPFPECGTSEAAGDLDIGCVAADCR